MNILVLGASGMLGNAVLRLLNEEQDFNIFGSVRTSGGRIQALAPNATIVSGVFADQTDSLTDVLARTEPDVVVNCVGLIKQLGAANDPLVALPINSLLPHRLAKLCKLANARLIHMSTDCVFSGAKGNYLETDPSDATDLYGRSKLIGEVHDEHCVTLRTSIIGHELSGAHSLIGWFLSQSGSVKGYRRAIFSGLPTVELARVIRDFVLPRPALSGLFHVAAQPISKYDLLKLVGQVYDVDVKIEPDSEIVIDRSLNADRFNDATGYVPPSWPELIARMHAFR